MTNSRLTDPEVLEWRFPVRLEIVRDPARQRRRGPHRGGDGAERRVRFLEPMTAVMLANHRRVAAVRRRRRHGPVPSGRNWVERADGTREEFGATMRSRDARGRPVRDSDTTGGGGVRRAPD